MRLRQFAVGSIVLLHAAAAFAQGAPAPGPAPVSPPPPPSPPQAYPPQQYPPQQYPPQQYPPQQYPPQQYPPQQYPPQQYPPQQYPPQQYPPQQYPPQQYPPQQYPPQQYPPQQYPPQQYPPQQYPPQQYPPQQYPPQQYPPQQYPPQAAPPAAPAPAKAEVEEPEPENEYGFHKRSSINLGGAFFGDSLGTQRFGVTLESNTVYPVAGRWGIGVRLGWGLTEWDRFDKWTSAGRSIGGWTTTAYSDVYHWSIKEDEYTLFRVIGSIYAYIGLLFPLIAAGVCYVGAIFSPTTFLEAAVTANYDFGGPQLGPFIELGLGATAFIHPKYDNLRGGIGPTFGGGVHMGHVRIGAHMTWSPHLLHGEASGGRSDVYLGGLTIGFTGT
ncbi:MAG TPA: hypothetical protein VHB79_17245 [Polyangiaceae bacterium]|nr:hypothetical protein [Polyangiaceae bacterium]